MNRLHRQRREWLRGLALLAAFVCLLLTVEARADSGGDDSAAVERFHKASAFYEKKNYAEAESLYRSILATGVESSAVHYNLGNCYFKQGKLGPAIASYLRAQRLAPRDPDIEQNLKYARSFQVDQEFSESKQSFTAALFRGLRDRFTLQEQLLVTVLLFWGLCAAWGGYLWKPTLTFLRTSGWVLLVVYLLAGGVAVSKSVDLNRPLAVIISPSATVTSGPDTGTALFTLHEGTTATARRHHGDWVQVSLPNGPTGWVQRSHLEFL